jgi:hypothetical protein
VEPVARVCQSRLRRGKFVETDSHLGTVFEFGGMSLTFNYSKFSDNNIFLNSIHQERDISFVINAMSDSLCRIFPKYRYLEANLFDKAMAYCIQFFPNLLTDRLRFFIQAQLLSN